MKILVLVKETLATETQIVLESLNKISDKGVKYIINPYDEFAIEEGLRIKEKLGGEVVLWSVGRLESQSTIRNGLDLGADSARLIVADIKDSQETSELLAEHILSDGKFDLILCGWIAIDDNQAQVPGRLSRLLKLPLVNVVTKLEIDGNQAICEREGDDVVETIEVKLPAIIAVQRGINEPRYPTVKSILHAKKKKINIIPATFNEKHAKSIVTYHLPAKEKQGLIIEGTDPVRAVELLIGKLKEEKLL